MKSDKSIVMFGDEMTLTYTHHGKESNSGKNFDMIQTVLSYDGHNINGLPQFCIDPSTYLVIKISTLS